VEPEETSITRQRLGEQVSAATDTQATIEELLRTMFHIRSVQMVIKKSSAEKVSHRYAIYILRSKFRTYMTI
jgi:hypothetical protein